MIIVRNLLLVLSLSLLISSCKLNNEILKSSSPNSDLPNSPPPTTELPPSENIPPYIPGTSYKVETKSDGTGSEINLNNIVLNSSIDMYLIKREDGEFVESVTDVEWQFVRVSDPKGDDTTTGDHFNINADDYGKYKIRVISTELTSEILLDMNVQATIESFSHPYHGLSLPDVTTLSDSIVPSSVDGTIYTRLNPLSGKKLTVDGTVTWVNSSNIFLRADTIHFQNNALIHADGKNYVNNSTAGAGGSGGGAPTGCGGIAGTGGSNGSNGSPATSGTCMGTAGVGYGSVYSAGFLNYGVGGDGGKGSNSLNGIGSNGAGGGGGATYNLWGGGAGGGGLIVIVANSITGIGNIRAKGGNGRHGVYGVRDIPGPGGGGVIFIATRNYSGNLQASALGGKGNGGLNYSGKEGTARIFQIMPDDSLIERDFMDTWSESGSYTSFNSSLPYSNALPITNTLADDTLADTTIDGYIYTRVNPYSAKQLTINGNVSHELRKPSAIFLRAESLIFSPGSVLSANGENGHDGHYGGEGGNGGAGGTGCGSTGLQITVSTGGVDGPRGGGTCPYGGGVGWGTFYAKGFFYGLGGRGGNSDIGIGGLGSNGAGGGGHSAYNLWGGGGGGGGLVTIVADSISGPGTITAKGGNRNGSTSIIGAGGGGVVWIATKSYSGELIVDVSPGIANGEGATAGTARIFKIESNNTLSEKTFSESF
ncbi:MAG: hypothetical protein KDD58_10690 [Bdellovibrionales bacterium]|nr:hypothetical protein [Bdellovibrionales bacterium]